MAWEAVMGQLVSMHTKVNLHAMHNAHSATSCRLTQLDLIVYLSLLYVLYTVMQ